MFKLCKLTTMNIVEKEKKQLANEQTKKMQTCQESKKILIKNI